MTPAAKWTFFALLLCLGAAQPTTNGTVLVERTIDINGVAVRIQKNGGFGTTGDGENGLNVNAEVDVTLVSNFSALAPGVDDVVLQSACETAATAAATAVINDLSDSDVVIDTVGIDVQANGGRILAADSASAQCSLLIATGATAQADALECNINDAAGAFNAAFQTAFESAINDDTNLAAANKTFNATNTTLETPTFALNAAAQGRCNQADDAEVTTALAGNFSAFGFIVDGDLTLQNAIERALLNATNKVAAANNLVIISVALDTTANEGAILNAEKTAVSFAAKIAAENNGGDLLECDLQGFRSTDISADLQESLNFELDQLGVADQSAEAVNLALPVVSLTNTADALRCDQCTACDIVDGKAGVVAQHFIGLVLVILLLPLGLDTIFRIYFDKYYQPGTGPFFVRSMILEMVDLFAVALVFEFDKDQVDEAVLFLPVACNSGAIMISMYHAIKSWSVSSKRRKLLERIDNVTTDSAGAIHVSDELQRDIDRFNDDERRRHEGMKSVFFVLFGMEIGDLAFVGNQYFNFCSVTACSYYGSLATVISMSMLVSSLRDYFMYRVYSPDPPLAIAVDDGKQKKMARAAEAKKAERLGQAAPKAAPPAAVSPLDEGQRYQHIRGLLDDMLKDSEAGLYMYAHPDLGTAPMSLEIHEMNQSADTDPRADACVWSTLIVRSVWRAACVDKDHISVATLHLIHQLVANVRKQLDGFSERQKLDLAVELLQRAATCLPPKAKDELASEVAKWTEAKQPAKLEGWCSKVVTGIDSDWEGEFMPIARLTDGVLEYRRARNSKKLDDLALYRDPRDHNWKITGIDANGDKRQPRFYTSTAWGESNVLDEPPSSGWHKNTPSGSQQELSGVAVVGQPFDTYAMRALTNSFLNDGKESMLQQLKVFSTQNYPIAVTDDALLQWAYMKATSGYETMHHPQAKAVARNMAEHLKKITPADSMPEWAHEAYDSLRGDPGESEFNRLTSSVPAGGAAGGARSAAKNVPLLCSQSALRDGSAIELILRATLDESMPVEQSGKDAKWPLETTLTYPTKERANAGSAAPGASGGWDDTGEGAYRQKFFRRSFTCCGRVLRIPPRFWFKNQFKDKIMYVLIGGLYLGIFVNAARLINTSNEDVDAITFFGLPPQYDMTDPLQAILVPMIYAVMHCNLLTFGLLPLPMARCTIKWLSSSPTMSQVLHLDHIHFWHRMLGYLFMGGVVLGGVFWWFALGHACVEETVDNFQTACDAFHTPPGGVNRAGEQLNFNALVAYVNIFENLAAVLFLRELVISSFIAMFSTALLVYPLGGNAISLPIGWVQRHAFEIFYYTHVVFAYVVAALAFASRFEVFYPTLPLWGWYVFDCLNMRFNHTMKTTALATYSGDPTHFVHLRVKKQGRFYLRCWQSQFHFSSGQTAFVNIPQISKLQWHPFSIASAPSDSHVEFLIDAGKYGKESWTGTLWHMLANRELAGNFDVNLMGPCGSAFQASKKHYGCVLIGGGSGLTSSLSVLRDILHEHRTNASANPQKVYLYWVTRHVDGMIWCWDALKRALEGEGLADQKKQNVAELSKWLSVSIHVTGAARSADERAALDRLTRAEQGSASEGLAGPWLLHGDRVKRSRVKSWRDEFISIHAGLPANANVKVLFCGPTPMAVDIGEAARSIKGFEAQFSSENFNEGKRPTPKALVGKTNVKVDGAHAGGGLDRALDDYKAHGGGGGGGRDDRTRSRGDRHGGLNRGTSFRDQARHAARALLDRFSMHSSRQRPSTSGGGSIGEHPNPIAEEAEYNRPAAANPVRTALEHQGVSMRNKDAMMI